MKAPLEWLKEYVEINVSTEELCEIMAMHGLCTEEVTTAYAEQDGVVIGRLMEITKHPNADKLQVCRVDVGKTVLQIVTGASNVYEGMICPVATNGALLPTGKKIVSGELRGEKSSGMLCSGQELLVQEEDIKNAGVDGILDMGEGYAAQIGQPFFGAIGLDGEVIDFEISANRADCMSIIGIAREIAAALGTKLTLPEIHVEPDSSRKACDYVKADIEDYDLCPRYTARVFEEIKVTDSPTWMQRRLQAAGVRPISSIVDITNYVMLELGQPLHAFDYSCIQNGHIIVRRAKENEETTTLDGRKHVLHPDILCIADEKGAVGLAGVMGGENSEITENTRMVLLESAKFDGANIRHTSKELGIFSEAAARYTKGTDEVNAEIASVRAAQLLQAIGCGKVLKGMVDVKREEIQPRVILVRPCRVNDLLGTNLPEEVMIECLHRELIEVELNDDLEMVCTIPHYRQDILLEEDVIEEIAKVYGYDNIPMEEMEGVLSGGGLTRAQKLKQQVRQTMASMGCFETMSFAFIGETLFDNAGFSKEDSRRDCVKIINPLSEEYALMRTTLIPSILPGVALNMKNKIYHAPLFEISNVYLKQEEGCLPKQKSHLCIGACGEAFFEIKGMLELLRKELGCTEELEYRAEGPEYYHPGRKAGIYLKGEKIGEMGELHPDVLEKQDMDKRACVAEIDLDALIAASGEEKQYQPLPKYPALERDMAMTVDKKTQSGPIMETMKKIGGALLERVELFDVYEGDQIEAGKKSMAFSLTFRAQDRTLKDEEANALFDAMVEKIETQYGALLRKA